MKKQTKKGFDRRTLKRVLHDLKRYRLMLLFSLLFAAVNVALTLYIPLLTGDAIDLIVGKGNVDFEGVTKMKLTKMKIISFVAMIAGIVLAIIGFSKNNDPMAVMESVANGGSTNPGTIWIILGVVAIAAGVVLLIIDIKKNKKA